MTKLTIEYDGERFAGWAAQPGERTVQGVLEQAIRILVGDRDVQGDELRLAVAGRTDRGVHAWGQVASYRHAALDPQRLNALLPADVAVRRSESAEEGFDARRDAVSRTYCYRVLARRERSVFMRGRALHWPYRIDRDALESCAAALVGSHDFTAFTPTQTEHVRFERRVIRAQWRAALERHRTGPPGACPAGHHDAPHDVAGLLELWIEADAFMRQMNRVLVGTMLEVASGRRTLEEFERLLTGRPRCEAGPTAPAHGLALAAVGYRAQEGRPELACDMVKDGR